MFSKLERISFIFSGSVTVSYIEAVGTFHFARQDFAFPTLFGALGCAVGCVYQRQTVGHWYDSHSVEVSRYYKWRRHVKIMAIWFSILAAHTERNCKNVSVEFQVDTSSASVKYLSIIVSP